MERMRRAPNYFLLLMLVVMIVTTNFSGCDSRGLSKVSSADSGKSGANSGPHPDAPDVTFKNLQGQDVSLASLKGKVVIVNFWATWCEPCRVEIPWMIGFHQKYADKGLTILGVAMDDEGRSVVAPFVGKERFDVNGGQSQMNYPIVIGNDAAADKFGGLIGYPTSVLIDRDGKQVKSITGLISYDDISKAIESHL